MTALARRFLAPGPARDLAVFRILVFAIVLGALETHQAARFGALPPSLRVPPVGTAWLLPHLPISPAIAEVAHLVLVASCALSLVGFYTRIATLLATLSGLYVLGLPQLAGSVVHNHHLVWFMALLAASPSGDALSLDARRRAAAPDSAAYAVPLRFAWLLLGIVYFFPGYWKWKGAGLAFALGDNLADQMRWKWLQWGGAAPAFRLDEHPAVLHAAGLAVMLFEPSFLCLVWSRRARPWLAGAAACFHVATDVFMRIRYTTLLCCLPVLLPWSRRRAGESCPPRGDDWRRARPALVVGALLVAGNTAFGLAGITNGWPFACYPTFHHLVGPEMPALAVEAVDAAGTRGDVDRAPLAGEIGAQRLWGLEWSLLAMSPGPARDRALEDHARRLLARSRASAIEVRCYRVLISVDPDTPRTIRRELLHAFPTR